MLAEILIVSITSRLSHLKTVYEYFPHLKKIPTNIYFSHFTFFSDYNGLWLFSNDCERVISPLHHSLTLYGTGIMIHVHHGQQFFHWLIEQFPLSFLCMLGKVLLQLCSCETIIPEWWEHITKQIRRQNKSMASRCRGNSLMKSSSLYLFLKHYMVHEYWLAFYFWDDFYIQNYIWYSSIFIFSTNLNFPWLKLETVIIKWNYKSLQRCFIAFKLNLSL